MDLSYSSIHKYFENLPLNVRLHGTYFSNIVRKENYLVLADY